MSKVVSNTRSKLTIHPGLVKIIGVILTLSSSDISAFNPSQATQTKLDGTKAMAVHLVIN